MQNPPEPNRIRTEENGSNLTKRGSPEPRPDGLDVDAGDGANGNAGHEDHTSAPADSRAAVPAGKRRSRAGDALLGRWKRGVERAVVDLATYLKDRYGQRLTDDKFAREFKQYAVFQPKRNLPPGPGRPADPPAAATEQGR